LAAVDVAGKAIFLTPVSGKYGLAPEKR